jgi:hypothetical protein
MMLAIFPNIVFPRRARRTSAREQNGKKQISLAIRVAEFAASTERS